MTGFAVHAAKYLRDEQLAAQVLVLAEGADGTGRRLEIQRPLKVTDADRELGLDTYCLVNEYGVSHYGGIVGVQVDGDDVLLTLTSSAAQILGSDEELRLQLAVSRETKEEVQEALKAILGLDMN